MGCGTCEQKETVFTIENSAELIGQYISEGMLKFPYPTWLSGRGIVIAAGGRKLLTNAYVCIRMLRKMGCDLPIEVWYLGSREYDQAWDTLVAKYDVKLVDAHAFLERYPHQRLNGWELKPYAIMLSSFKEVLFLDADNVVVRNPSYLFDTPEYQETGCIFWPDFGKLGRDRLAWKAFGVEYRDEPEIESGQIVIDKHKHGHSLILTNWVMNFSSFFFSHVHGDKEIFHLCWRRLNAPYSMPSRGIDAIHGTMCQHDFTGKRVFQHRNMLKWTLENNTRVLGFLYEEECIQILNELRTWWDPISKATSHLTEEDKEASAALVGMQFRYFRLGYDDRTIRLSQHNAITTGSAGREAYWWVHNGKLTIVGDDLVPTCLFEKFGDLWIGRWEAHERMFCVLQPES